MFFQLHAGRSCFTTAIILLRWFATPSLHIPMEAQTISSTSFEVPPVSSALAPYAFRLVVEPSPIIPSCLLQRCLSSRYLFFLRLLVGMGIRQLASYCATFVMWCQATMTYWGLAADCPFWVSQQLKGFKESRLVYPPKFAVMRWLSAWNSA